jgi:hypothetical protein
VAAAALARLDLLLTRPPWFDEVFTAWAARLSPARLLWALRLDSGPPLFYLLERPAAMAADRIGAPDSLLRVLSFLAVAALPLAALALPDPPTRRRFLVLTAASPLLLVYAAEARPYALLSAFGLALFVLSLAAEERGPLLSAAALIAAAALYTHYLAIFLVGSLAIVALLRRRGKSAAALLAGCALFAPWLPTLLRQPAEATAWMHEPAAFSSAAMLSALGGAGRVPDPLGGPLPSPLLWAGAAIGLLALAGVAAARSEAVPARDAVLVTLLTLSGVLLASLLGRAVAFPGRTELSVLPIWLWGLASAAGTSRLARAAVAAAALSGALSCAALLAKAPRESPPYVETAAKLVRETGPSDVIAAGGAYYLPLRLASETKRLAARLVAVPSELAKHPGWIPARTPAPKELLRLGRELAAVPPGGRAYLLVPSLLDSPGLREALSGGGAIRALDGGPGATLLVRDPAVSP